MRIETAAQRPVVAGWCASIPVFFVSIMVTALAGCQRVAAPPDTPPRVSEDGYRFADDVLLMLRTARTIHDIREASQRFSFGPAIADDFLLRLPDWTSEGLAARVSASLAKSRSAAGSPLAGAAKALAASAGTSVPAGFGSDSVVADTVLADSTRVTVFLLDSAAAGTWAVALDSLFRSGGLAGAETLAVVRTRVDSTGDTLVTDRQQWRKETAGWVAGPRVQTRVRGTTLLYRHRAVVANGVIYDSVRTTGAQGQAWYSLQRRDTSAGWWNSMRWSQVLQYNDSTVNGDTTIVQVLEDADTNGTAFDFAATGEQVVGIALRMTFGPARNALSLSLRQAVGASGDIMLRSYAETVVRQYLDSTTSRLSGFDYASGRCSLYVSVVPLTVTARDSTPFGIRGKTDYRCRMRFSTLLDTLTFLSIYRRDYMPDSSAVKYTEYYSLPTDTTAYVPGASGLTVRAWYSFVEPVSMREWTFVPDRPSSQYTYLGVGANRDSVRVTFRGDTLRRAYAYSRPALVNRRGTQTFVPQGGLSVSDSLSCDGSGHFRRFVAGTLWPGDTGSFSVNGRDTLSIVFVNDTLITVTPSGTSLPLDGPFSWRVRGDSLIAAFGDSVLAIKGTVRLTVDCLGRVKGTVTGTNAAGLSVLRAEAISVGTGYGGSARVYGIVTGPDASEVRVDLSISLWGDSRLADEQTFIN